MIPACCPSTKEWYNIGGFSYSPDEKEWRLELLPERNRPSAQSWFYSVTIRHCPWCGQKLPLSEECDKLRTKEEPT